MTSASRVGSGSAAAGSGSGVGSGAVKVHIEFDLGTVYMVTEYRQCTVTVYPTHAEVTHHCI